MSASCGPISAMGCMASWPTKIAVTLLAASCLPGFGQSLGDAARAERERQSKLRRHAPVLTEDDLRNDEILPRTAPDFETARPAERRADAPISSDLPLGDYARALRERRAREQAVAARAAAAKTAADSVSTRSGSLPVASPANVTRTDRPVKIISDFARQDRSERDATHSARMDRRPSKPAVEPTQLSTETPARSSDQGRTAPSTAPSVARSREIKSQPGRQTSESPLVVAPEAKEHENAEPQSIRVPRGASLWKLAYAYLGAGRLWPALWKANPEIRNPNHLRAGQLLRCPVLSDQERIELSRRADRHRPKAGVSRARAVTGKRAATTPASPVFPAAQMLGQTGQLTPISSGSRSQRRRKAFFSPDVLQ